MRHGPPGARRDATSGGPVVPEEAVADLLGDEPRISLYRGERRPGRRYRELWTGPGLERLLGGAIPPDVDPGQLVLDRMPTEDRERIERLFAYEALLDVDSVETDYRVVGLDGVMRIVRDRADVRDRDAERVVFDGSLVDVTAERRLIDDMGAVERRLEAAAAVAGLALWQVEFDVDGRVLRSDIVPGLEVLLGGPLEAEDLPRAYAERVHPDDRPAFDEHVLALAAGQRTTVEYRLRGVDGRTRWIWTRAAAIEAGAGRRVSGVSADVTERRRHDDDLLETRRQVGSLLRTVGVVLVTTEFAADGTALDVRAHGEVEHFIGRPLPPGPAGLSIWLDHVHPDDRAAFRARIAELWNGDTAEATYRVRHDDGTERRVRSQARRRERPDGENVVLDVIILDVTDAERTAAALEDAEQRLAQVLRSIDDIVYSVEVAPDGTLGRLEANGRWFAMFGRPGTPGPTTAELFMAAVHPDDHALVQDGNQILARGDAIEQEYRVVDRTGRERWLLDRAWPRRRADGSRVADGIQVDITARRRAEQELRLSRAGAARLATEQTLLREMATAIAAGRPQGELFPLAARQATRLVDGGHGAVVRFEGGTPEIVGAWHEAGPAAATAIRSAGVTAAGAADAVLRTGLAARRALHGRQADADGRSSGAEATEAAAPVRVGRRLWGAVTVVSRPGEPLTSGADARLADVAELVSLGVSEGETRRLLAERALSDPLTGLANHRAFHEELATEVVRARRYDRRLSLVLLDVDHFKAINDSSGHPVGDATLQRVADLLQSLVRSGELVGRVGGDELALLLPETDAAGAAALAERAREALVADPLHGNRLTLSAGVAELSGAADADELYDQADRALLWTKRHGRDGVSRYDPRTMHDGAAQDHDGRLARSHARAGLHALVRAVDLREPRLTGHAERVGALADRLADRLGWSPARRALLREAAFLHDVGKVAIPAAVLGAGTALDADARSSTRAHPVLGADMSAEVLDREQASWIRHHHEWWDGGGYPDGLQGEEIPDGARLLGLAEAWDAMTRTGPGDRPRTRAEALAECRRQAGTQFAPDAVDALEALGASADLPGPADH